MMGVFSDLERNMISERVKSGMAKGKVVGRPTTTLTDIPAIAKKTCELLKNVKINKSECARMFDSSRSSLDKYIKIIECKES